MAWERLHVLARNPIPPASSDNSLSASFPPPPPPPAPPPHPSPPACASAAVSSFSCSRFTPHTLSTPSTTTPLLPGGRSSVSTYLPPATHQTDAPLAVPLQDLCTSPLLSFLLCSLSCFLSLFLSVAFSNFPYAPTNLRCARKRQAGREGRKAP